MLNPSQFSPHKLKEIQQVLNAVLDHFSTANVSQKFNKISISNLNGVSEVEATNVLKEIKGVSVLNEFYKKKFAGIELVSPNPEKWIKREMDENGLEKTDLGNYLFVKVENQAVLDEIKNTLKGVDEILGAKMM